MSLLNKLSGIALLILSAYMLLSGLAVFYNTQGVVRGSEFSVLITIAGQISQVMLWLGLFAFWAVSAKAASASKSNP